MCRTRVLCVRFKKKILRGSTILSLWNYGGIGFFYRTFSPEPAVPKSALRRDPMSINPAKQGAPQVAICTQPSALQAVAKCYSNFRTASWTSSARPSETLRSNHQCELTAKHFFQGEASKQEILSSFHKGLGFRV